MDKIILKQNETKVMCKCKFCNTRIDYEGYSCTNGHIWACEKCEEWVCSLCVEKAGGSVCEATEHILCPNCLRDEKHKQ